MKTNQHQAGANGKQPAQSKQARKNQPIHRRRTPAREYVAHEVKVVSMRDCPLARGRVECADSLKAADYWRTHVRMHPYFSPDTECATVIMVDSRMRVQGHHMMSVGSINSVLIHPREVFRAAVVMNAAAIIVVHNHPSGDPSPSESDIKATRDLIRAGKMLMIEVLDHLVMGAGDAFASLRLLGYFYELDSAAGIDRTEKKTSAKGGAR